MNSLVCQRELHGTRPCTTLYFTGGFALPFQKFIPCGDLDRAKIEICLTFHPP
ncbi:hypothetical protein BV455_03936 [Parageobacillus caldoxylosilyticus]|jgi:hypothetical protein|uniref:Uncharacterized protein n=1 Tax=Parageobacillus caldoxylosilyticus NBRC 107762 TaxID=1220594 RepID=A0A023DIZ9_9BACL|nr:hypothetical protein [Parageobacillus caldoxylosilyticus]QXJ40562.1 hypothetical protein BV455_03936 [Parageobacillus caldoxylosilyticus]BDG43342.1 hypothetical protein PcaKH35_16870 [Parageobacillus caldoxylosilyticus]GAJ41218.1 hypothetical protein GCA01S_060_00330 [Parageobacillus caldoxylosilyticus NBRC 107762]